MILDELPIHAPSWLPNNVVYLTIMGSFAYGVTSESSDLDLYGICLPPKDLCFPHLRGEIPNFGKSTGNFLQWSEHHISHKEKEYDVTVYSIIRYFDLCLGCNPNMIDSLFTSEHCILHITPIGQKIRENRRLFLSSKCWHTFKGYAWQQCKKLDRKPEGKRSAIVEKYGYDTKYASHIFRLLDECDQLLTTGDLILGRNREEMKAIREGFWTLEHVKEEMNTRLTSMESLYSKSVLPYSPDEEKIKSLLLECISMHYEKIENFVYTVDPRDRALREIESSLSRLDKELYGDINNEI